MQFTNLLHLSYWFAVYTPPLRRFSFIAAIIVVALFIGGGIVFKILSRRKKDNPPLARGLSKLSRPFWFFAAFMLILIWSRQVGAVILSARGWTLLIFLITVSWFAVILKGVLKNYKREYAQLAERKKYEEYLPKKKR
ncbi:hypothetical protein HYW17_01830 [Candidatus Uhrbacteria bacterium]|nr:hypothetical protein [Candidatus Uhrbacteria bacterium]